MRKILLLLALLGNCTHRQQPLVEKKPVEVFFIEPKPGSHYRQHINTQVTSGIVTVVSVGDIMLGEAAASYINRNGFSYPFDSTRSLLVDADLTIGNLEAPFSKTGIRFEKEFTFKIHPKYSASLLTADFDVVTLANNHTMDFGKQALINTIKTLDSIGVAHCGAGKNHKEAKAPAILEANGFKVAFLGYSCTFPQEFWAKGDSAGTCFPYEEMMIRSIQACDSLAQFTVVSYHWGQELRNTPKDYQIYLAHKAIDSGADLILGHHPHILQGLEIYKNRLIVYSLGNFAFGSYSYKAKESMIVKSYLTPAGLLFAKITPLNVFNDEVLFQPKVLKSARADSMLSYLNKISYDLNHNTNIIDKNGTIWGHGISRTDSLTANTLTNESTSQPTE